MESVPLYVHVGFAIVVHVAALMFLIGLYRTFAPRNIQKASAIVVVLGMAIFAWMGVTAMLSLYDYFLFNDANPPRFIIIPGVPAILFLILMAWKSWNWVSDAKLSWFTYIHVVRIPVEIGLWMLAGYEVVPELMTFEGRNFDILAGITAPIIAYFCFTRKSWSPKIALVWHIIALGLLINIVVNAILSLPGPFQHLAFDQPNVAVLYFPFVWLPGIIVPLVLASHVISIFSILKGGGREQS